MEIAIQIISWFMDMVKIRLIQKIIDFFNADEALEIDEQVTSKYAFRELPEKQKQVVLNALQKQIDKFKALNNIEIED